MYRVILQAWTQVKDDENNKADKSKTVEKLILTYTHEY